ncbi:MAG: 5'-nucleotidase C-terminal domain-containing protein [Gemmatimonadales bacterium]
MFRLLLAASLVSAPIQDSAHVVLVATTDVHGHATAWNYVAQRPFPGGLARVVVVVDSLRRRYPGQVVVMDAGDLLQGDPFASYHARVARREPHPIVEAMNLAGYDVATLGNHDFDWGVPALYRALRDAAFPYVSANIYAVPADTLVFRPYRVLQRQGVRIGVAGFTTPGTMVWNRAQMTEGKLRVAPIGRTAGPTLEAMRRDADLSVVLIHSGMDEPLPHDTLGIGAEHSAAVLAAQRAPPHVVVVGHSHREMRDSVIGGVHFVQPRPYGGTVAVVHVDLARRGGAWRVTRVRADAVSTRDVPPSPVIIRRLAAAHGAVSEWVDATVGEARAPMRAAGARAEPTPVLDWILEVQRRRTGAMLSSTSAFDPRAGFDSGAVRRAQVLALYPYDNTLRAVKISGAKLRAYLEWSARYFEVDPAGRVTLNDSVPGYDYDVVRGARYELDLRQPVGDRVRDLSVRGRPVAPTDSFTLALNSHRQTGAGGYDMLPGAPVVYDKGENIPELLVQELSRGPLDPAAIPPSEWRIVPEVLAAAAKNLFGLAPRAGPRGPSDTVRLRVLATADLHGALRNHAAALSTTMDSLGAECGCATLRLDAGDAMQGGLLPNATAGRAAVEVLNRLGFAASVLGDGDFNWSVDTLRRRMAESRYPWLAANVFDSSTGRRPSWAIPYRMIEKSGMRVALIGYITPDTKTLQPAERTRGLRFGVGELAIHDVLAEVRGLAPSLTILLAHDSDVLRLAEQLGGAGVDLIVSGHGHRVVDTRVAGIAVVGPDGPANIAVADLVRTSAGGRELRVKIEPASLVGARAGPALAAALERFGRQADSLESRPLARMKRPLVREGRQHPLGALVAEARRNVGRAHIGLVRNQSLMADLPAGPVTYRGLSEVEPSRGTLVRLTLSGTGLLTVLEHALAATGGPTVHLAGALVRYDPKAPAGRRVKSIVLQGGRKLRAESSYTLVTDDSTAAGAGGFTMLSGRPLERLGLLDLEATAAFLRRLPQPVEVGPASNLVSTRR